MQTLREQGSVALDGVAPEMERVHIAHDFSLASLSQTLKWFIKDIQVIRVPVPETEPDWIRQAHPDGLTQFDQAAELNLLRATYYLGETFVRNCSKLNWTIGNPEFIHKNMPVVSGFTSDRELAPLLVMNNIAKRIVGDGVPWDHVDTMVAHWSAAVPVS